MKKSALLSFLIIFSLSVSAQGFQFDKPDRKKISIPFKLINNLIFLPIKVNGVELNFLLDTGVEETILFSLEDKGNVSFYDVKKIKLIGLGNQDAIEGLKSSNNTLAFKGLTDKKHDIYIVLDQTFNFSSQIGIPVNGIIGYHFFKNHLVEIDYNEKRIIVYQDNPKLRKKINSRYKEVAISIEKSKPYAEVALNIQETPIAAKLLIDLGNSDAVWLFENKSNSIRIPEKNFNDFLGRGFSGEIHGKRARINDFDLHGFKFSNTLVAFPDSSSTKNISMVDNRIGSIGGEIFKRFSIVFDYQNHKMYLRKGNYYDLPFNYNMSGIEIHHEGMTWVKEKIALNTDKKSVSSVTVLDNRDEFNYKFELKPVYQILNVRNDSPADLCGIMKGDIIVSINGLQGYRYTLQELNSIMKSEEGKTITIEVDRKGVIMKFRFKLKSML